MLYIVRLFKYYNYCKLSHLPRIHKTGMNHQGIKAYFKRKGWAKWLHIISWTLTIFFLKEFLIYFDTRSMKLSIVYFKGFYKMMDFCPWSLFYLSKQCRPWWNAALCGILSGSSLFAFTSIQNDKGLICFNIACANRERA